jgi:hypothetical protein
VPCWTTCSSIEFNVASSFRSRTCVETGEFQSSMRFPSVTRRTARGWSPSTLPSIRAPLSANVEKARAISSGLTASTPSPIAE